MIFSKKNFYSQEDLDILRLIRSENVGNRTFILLTNLFGSATEALKHVGEFALRGGKKRAIKVCSKESALKEIELQTKNNSYFITYKSKFYSKLLLEIPNFPIVLTYKGNINFLNEEKIIAIVGSRNCSVNGKIFANKISKELVEKGFITVSGMALGIDTQVHQSSLGRTIAVLAGGIDHIYPFANKYLYDKLAETSLIISELPIGVTATGRNFPQRNRIISGLALATTVIEAGEKSGSLITARLALEQNREVFATPGFPLDPKCYGSNKLIKNGLAHLLSSTDDILENILINKKDMNIKEDVKDKPPTTLSSQFINQITNKDRKVITSALSPTPVSFEELSGITNIDIKIVYTICLELELAGKVHRDEYSNKIYLIYND